MQEIRKKLNSLSDQEYKKFHSSLCPNAKNMIGVRIPELRRMAKEIANTNGKEFLEKYQFEYYEERMLQGFVIGYMKLTIEERIKYLDKFVPNIDNWAVCDCSVSTFKFTKKNMEVMWKYIQKYFNSSKEFEVRFAIVMLLNYYLEEQYIDKALKILNKVNHVVIKPGEVQVTEGEEENLAEYRNIALFGIDTTGTYEGSRSDCIIIASINQKTKEIKLVSVYRDTYLEIPNYGLDKVNHAYAYGGPALSMSTLNTNLDLNITEFATVNFTSTQEIIDAIGGIEMTVTDAEATQIPGIVEGGTYELTGAQALAYARIRKIDNDYARTERMRKVIIAVFEKAKTMSIMELNKLADKLLPHIYTNIETKEILSLIPTVASYKIVESKGWPYKTQGITLNGVWYGPPITLEQNVVELHKELFGEEDYKVTDKIKEISEKIIQKTGYR